MIVISYRANGQTSNIERVNLWKDAGATTGTEGDPFVSASAGSTGLIIATIANNEASPTVYTVTSSNVETIGTLGTYAAPTAGKCRFAEIDSVNMPGLYEFQLADARYAVTSAQYLDVTIHGVADLAAQHVRIYLDTVDESGLRSALGLASANLDTQLGNIPTVTEFEARTLTSSGAYATLSNQDTMSEVLQDWQTGAATIYANVQEVNGVTIIGSGSADSLFRTAGT